MRNFARRYNLWYVEWVVLLGWFSLQTECWARRFSNFKSDEKWGLKRRLGQRRRIWHSSSSGVELDCCRYQSEDAANTCVPLHLRYRGKNCGPFGPVHELRSPPSTPIGVKGDVNILRKNQIWCGGRYLGSSDVRDEKKIRGCSRYLFR